MIISASQIETHTQCARKWFFQSVQKLPQMPKGSQSLGIVLHSVAERWHKADDLGRGEDGKPIDLYPAGWEIDDKGNPISAHEQLMLQEMVSAAIAGGVWERLPGRRVEWGFMMPVIDDVEMMGFCDVLMPDGVWDHKTTSKQRYAKGIGAIAASAQMNIYASALLSLREMEGAAPLSTIQLRHNTFIFENLKARKTVAEVDVGRVRDFWSSQVIPRAERMLKHRTLKSWHDFEPPPPSACQEYGGCPFLSICGGIENPEQYSKRVLRLLEATAIVRGTKTPQQKRSDMSVADRLAKLRKPATAAAPAAAAPTTPAAAPAAPKAAAPAPATAVATKPAEAPVKAGQLELASGNAPWAKPTCVACKGTGFNSKGAACQICVSLSRKAGGPVPENYDIVVEDGFIAWQPKEGGEPVATQTLAGEPTTSEKVAEAPPEPKKNPAPKVDEAPVENPKEPKEPPVEEAPVENPSEPKDSLGITRPRGRQPRGFRLFVGCTPTGGKQKRVETKTIDQIFSAIRDQIVTDSKVDSFYLLPAFGHGKDPGRRDVACAYLEKQIGALGPIDIVCMTDSPDVRALVDVLRGYADEVVESTAR